MPVDILERLSNDESLTDNLTDDEAELLFAWAESRCDDPLPDEECSSIIAAIRRLNEAVGEGERFDEELRKLKGEEE